MSPLIKPMYIPDTFVEQASRAIAFEYRRAMEMYNVQVSPRDEYVFGAEVKRILTMYDEGRIRENEAWRKMATDALMQSPGKPFVIGGSPVPLDPIDLIKNPPQDLA